MFRETEALLADLEALALKPQSQAAIFRRYEAGCRRARKAMDRCRHSHDADDFHRWRKRVKTCYYQSLALHAASKLAHHLGQEHDLALLAERVPASGDNEKWLDLFDYERRRLHRKLLRQKKKICRKPHFAR